MSDNLGSAKDLRQVGRSGTVRVVLPAKVAYDLDLFTKSLRELAEKIGHPACLSGLDFHFLQERDFVVNPAGQVQSAPGGFAG